MTHILVAHDDDDFRSTLVGGLKLFGYEADAARNGAEFYEKADALAVSGPPFVLIVDNEMPDRRGAVVERWCGLRRVVQLCNRHRPLSLGQRVLFLSVWGLMTAPDDLRAVAQHLGLGEQERWLKRYTPFAIIRTRIDDIAGQKATE